MRQCSFPKLAASTGHSCGFCPRTRHNMVIMWTHPCVLPDGDMTRHHNPPWKTNIYHHVYVYEYICVCICVYVYDIYIKAYDICKTWCYRTVSQGKHLVQWGVLDTLSLAAPSRSPRPHQKSVLILRRLRKHSLWPGRCHVQSSKIPCKSINWSRTNILYVIYVCLYYIIWDSILLYHMLSYYTLYIYICIVILYFIITYPFIILYHHIWLCNIYSP